MSENAVFGVAIVGSNQTGKAAKDAERRLGQIPKNAGQVSRRGEAEQDRRFAHRTRTMARTFGQVEKAGARLLGGSSMTSGLVSRLGGVTEAASALGEGLGAASIEGGTLATTLGTVGVVAASTAAIAVAAGAAAVKMADGWSKSTLSIGNTAAAIGISTRAMTEFTAAAERAGVDKDKAVNTLSGLSSSLNGAAFGDPSSTGTQALLRYLKIDMVKNADGTANIQAMLPAIANAFQHQNAYGRQKMASILGVDPGAIAALAQGGKQLSADMKEAEQYAPITTDEDVDNAKRMQRRHVGWKQRGRRAMDNVGRGVTRGVDAVETFGIDAAANGLQPAADRAAAAIGVTGWRSGGRMSRAQIGRRAANAMSEYQRLRARGASPADAAAWAAVGEAESENNPQSQQPGGPGQGLYQWGSTVAKYDRRRDFRRVMGKGVLAATRDEQYAFRDWELANTERRAARHIAAASGAGDKAAAITKSYERPAEPVRDSADRANIAEEIIRRAGPIPVKVEIDMRGAPHGTSAKVTAGSGKAPAISYAM